MSAFQQAQKELAQERSESALLRHQITTARAAADFEITAARQAQAAAEERYEGMERNFHAALKFIAVLGGLVLVMGVTMALHWGVYHSSSSESGAASASSAAPHFSTGGER